ncbi:hypothetical protein [Peromfec virus RodF8_12]|uniref:Uncharacterized protein n=1 Tax=Peromfec virus RodF8_12 TaxID=2929358 RepID=A0A976R5I7_9VIRU|nr:hypothetical protein [Peromfec virus RodF8_12]
MTKKIADEDFELRDSKFSPICDFNPESFLSSGTELPGSHHLVTVQSPFGKSWTFVVSVSRLSDLLSACPDDYIINTRKLRLYGYN